MEAIVVALMALVFLLGLGLTSAIIHIRAIQKELEALSEVDEEQDEMITKVLEYNRDLALAIRELQNHVIQQQSQSFPTYPYGGPIGEA
jgi:hypothetical protein